MDKIRNILFYLIISHFIISFISLVILPFIPFDYLNTSFLQFFYWNICAKGIPIAILLSVFWSVRREFTLVFNLTVVGITFFMAYGFFIFILIYLGLWHFAVLFD